MSRTARARGVGVLLLTAFSPKAAHAQALAHSPPCDAIGAGAVTEQARGRSGKATPALNRSGQLSPARDWEAPLNRLVTIHMEPMALRAALELVSARASFRLSYTRELLPLTRVVCVDAVGVAAGAVLVRLLEGTGVTPVVAGGEQVVLAPIRVSAHEDSVAHNPAREERSPTVLAQVVVTAPEGEGPARQAPAGVSVTVVTGPELRRAGVTSLQQAFSGLMPGLWTWSPDGNGAGRTLVGAGRGASTFGVSTPAIVVDGIPLASSLLLPDLDAESIDRIEMTRGPQGAARNGGDAMDGVIRIYTRSDGGEGDRTRVMLRSEAGMTGSDWAKGGVPSHHLAADVRGGSAFRTASLGASLTESGDIVPGAALRRLGVQGSARLLGSAGSLSTFVRASSERGGNATSPLLADIARAGLNQSFVLSPSLPRARRGGLARDDAAIVRETLRPASMPQTVGQYTLGVNATTAALGRWRHTLVGGVDGYRLAGVPLDAATTPSPLDSALLASRGASDRASLRVTSSASIGDRQGSFAEVAFAADHSLLSRSLALRSGGTSAPRSPVDAVTSQSNSGVSAQLDAALGALALGAALRLDRSALATGTRIALLPSLGASAVQEIGAARLTLRVAGGRAVRQPQLPAQLSTGGWGGNGHAATLLHSLAATAPEEQVGVEGGVDLVVGPFSAHVTHFEQRASSLLQGVALEGVDLADPDARGWLSNAWGVDDVGAIRNRGWELQSGWTRGALRLDGMLSLVESRVVQVAERYRGDLRSGDRMLGVPARVAGVQSGWDAGGWTLSLGATRAWDWIGYDRLSLARETHGSGRAPAGALLRAYWTEYDGATRLRASVSRALSGGVSLRLAGENLLGIQRGEPDNATIVPGRSLRLGVTTRF